jgi:quinolinate synthase
MISMSTGANQVDIASGTDFQTEINRLRKDLNAVILAHYYQEPEIQDIADFVGDSLALSRRAAEVTADVIVFAGVHFMAETAKIINPEKQVLLPDMAAGCSLADGCPPDEFEAFLKQYPDHTVVSYINCSARTKAASDIICTSGNAMAVVESLPRDEKIVFAPDRHLGGWIQRQTGRDMVLWPGSCEVHEQFNEQKLVELKQQHSEALVLAHPECTESLLLLADHIGSTASILAFSRKTEARELIVATESGILHQMQLENPDKVLIPVPGADETCNCNECPYMRLNTMEKLYLCMRDRTPEITLDESLRQQALAPILKMLDLG